MIKILKYVDFLNHKFQWRFFIGTGLCRMGFWWSSLRQFQSHSASLLESFCESIYLLLFFWGLFVSCCLSCSSWLLFRASLFGDGVRILVLFLSSDPPVPGLREEKCWKGLLENFGFLLVFEIVQQIDTRDWRRHKKGVRVFPISQTSTSRQLLLVFCFLDPAQFT